MPRSRVAAWGPAIAMMAVIFVASSLPTVPSLPGDPANHAAHVGAYAVLAALLLRGVAQAVWVNVTGAAARRAWILAVAYGATDEIHQRFVPGRYPGFDDWVADAVGAAVGVIAVLAMRTIVARRSGGSARNRSV